MVEAQLSQDRLALALALKALAHGSLMGWDAQFQAAGEKDKQNP
jgi:hypothetical protein